MLALGNLRNCSEKEVKNHISAEFKISFDSIENINVLVAYESEPDYEMSNWFLFVDEGRLYENHGSHCSCYGFEEQWKPEETSKEYLLSDKMCFYASDEMKEEIRNFLVATLDTVSLIENNRRAAVRATKRKSGV